MKIHVHGLLAEGTPEELDAELPAALLTYTREVNELRATISLPTEAIEADKAKASIEAWKLLKKQIKVFNLQIH